MLDADFNELVELIDRRLRAETIDIIGHCIVPSETPDAFLIGLAGGGIIDRARTDVRRRPPRREPRRRAARVVPGTRGGTRHDADRLRRAAVPARRGEPPAGPDPGRPVSGLRRCLEARGHRTEDAGLVEKAVGVDTARRTQTVWQVKVYPPTGSDVGLKGPITCDTPDGDITGWLDFTAPSAGRLTTEGQGVPATDDPCVIPPDGGYRGSENRLYRVEVHDPGGLGAATFKWSRDNASIATNVLAIDAARTELTVTRTARDAVLRFSTGDWVEVTDDEHELYGLPGVMRKIGPVDDVALTVTLTTALPAGTFDATDPLRHTRIKRWDQKGVVRDAAQNAVDDVDTNGGVIKVPAAGTTLVIEDGIQVTLSVDPAGGRFRSGDYWVFAARTVDASVDELVKAPPRGIHHHYCRLAILDFSDKGGPEDCRTIWPLPCQCEGEGGGCGCDACVTVESHRSGVLTIQDAVKQVVEAGGGTVCIGPGRYPLRQGVAIEGALSLRVRGAGVATVLLYAGDGPALSIGRSIDVRVQDLTIIGVRRGETAQNSIDVADFGRHRPRAPDGLRGPGRVARLHPERHDIETTRRGRLARWRPGGLRDQRLSPRRRDWDRLRVTGQGRPASFPRPRRSHRPRRRHLRHPRRRPARRWPGGDDADPPRPAVTGLELDLRLRRRGHHRGRLPVSDPAQGRGSPSAI